MRWSERLAIGFVPLLARLLLCAALLPLGWHQVFTTRAYSARDASRLGAIGVTANGLDFSRVKATGPTWAGGEASTTALAGADTPLTARSLYSVALECEAGGLPWPALAAWAVALTELVGPLLLVAGFFARIAAFAVSVVMMGALAATSIPALRASGWWSLPDDDHTRLWMQGGLIALALTVLLVGPGWLTAERVLSPRAKAAGDGPSK